MNDQTKRKPDWQNNQLGLAGWTNESANGKVYITIKSSLLGQTWTLFRNEDKVEVQDKSPVGVDLNAIDEETVNLLQTALKQLKK